MVAGILLSACGGSEPKSPEEALRSRVESFAKAFEDEKWNDAYQYLSPAIRSTCSATDFAKAIDLSAGLVRGFLGIADDAKMEVKVGDVTVEGITGKAALVWFVDGEPLAPDNGSEDDPWILQEGTWWVDSPDSQDGCTSFGDDTDTTQEPTQEPGPGRFIKLVHPLDEPEFYCVDVPGAGRGVNLQAALQAHTCKPLAEADDELFTLGYPGDGQIYMAAYDLCIEADESASGAFLHLRPCSDTPLQRLVNTRDGPIHLESDTQWVFCLSVAAGEGVPTGGPSHLRRDLALNSCGDPGSPLSTWRVTNR